MSSMYIMEPATSGKVCLNTTVGDIDVELWTRECPLACRNFIQHCLDGYYDGVIFHRLIRDFIVQTGDPTGTGQGGDPAFGEFFKSEYHQRLHFNRRGLLGFAGEEKDHNGSQFFFTLNATPELNKKHTLFGKIAGDTVFNMLKLNNCDVDQNDRPTRTHKIVSTKVLLNPFKDLKPRQKCNEERRQDHEQRKRAAAEHRRTVGASKQRNTGLLSFADEMDEEEEEGNGFVEAEANNKKFKSKSAHDVLEDDYLSKQRAVYADELGDRLPIDEEEDAKDASSEHIKRRVRERMATRAAKVRDEKVDASTSSLRRTKDENEDDELLGDVVGAQKRDDEKAKLKELADELKSLQKEYVKSVRGPKQRKEEDEEASLSAAMRAHNKMKLKFKTANKHVVRQADEKRQIQSMNLLERFNTKMGRASVGGILADKKIDVSDLPSQTQVIEMASLQDQGNIEFDGEDIETDDWINHKLVAPEGMRRDAKDANRKDESDDWYAIDDPRNKLNVRRREGAPNIDE